MFLLQNAKSKTNLRVLFQNLCVNNAKMKRQKSSKFSGVMIDKNGKLVDNKISKSLEFNLKLVMF